MIEGLRCICISSIRYFFFPFFFFLYADPIFTIALGHHHPHLLVLSHHFLNRTNTPWLPTSIKPSELAELKGKDMEIRLQLQVQFTQHDLFVYLGSPQEAPQKWMYMAANSSKTYLAVCQLCNFIYSVNENRHIKVFPLFLLLKHVLHAVVQGKG